VSGRAFVPQERKKSHLAPGIMVPGEISLTNKCTRGFGLVVATWRDGGIDDVAPLAGAVGDGSLRKASDGGVVPE
jgi:hypothetical protein